MADSSEQEAGENDDCILTEEQIKEYKEAFSVFDKDGDGVITVAELKTVLVTLGKDSTDAEVQEMVESVDENKNGTIEFSEFLRLMEKEVKSFESEAMIREAFEVFDQEGDGYITIRKLKQVIQDLGCTFTEEEIDEMMELADEDGDGRVEYEGLIGLLSLQNETLFSAYQKRVKKEEREREHKEEMAKRIPVESVEATEPDLTDRIPAMTEIASQYEPEVYDQFSRKVVPGGRTIVRKPGKKVEISGTRMKYLQRKNKALQQIDPDQLKQLNVETPMPTTNGSVNTQRELGLPTKSMLSHSPDSRIGLSPRPSPMTEMWLGTIHDERQQFDTRFIAKPPKQYRHVVSRLKEPNYHLRHQKGRRSPEQEFTNNKHDMTPRRSQNNTTRTVDLSKEFKELCNQRRQNIQITKSAENTKTVGVSSVANAYKSPRRQQVQSYSDVYSKDRLQSIEKMYYSIWRSAFNNAIEKLREDKKQKIILNTPELIAELERNTQREQNARKTLRRKPVKRLSVISPSLDPANQKSRKDTTVKQVIAGAKGSYTHRFRKLAGMEYPQGVERVPEKTQGKSVVAKQPKMNLLERRSDVISKAGLDRMLNIKT